MDARRTAGLLALGAALAWAVKLTLIAANGGENLDAGAVGAAYLAGLGLFVLTGVALGPALTADRPLWVRIGAALAGPVAVLLVMMVLDGVGEPLVGDAGPSWLPDEVGIGLMVLVGLVTAALLLRRRAPARSDGVLVG